MSQLCHLRTRIEEKCTSCNVDDDDGMENAPMESPDEDEGEEEEDVQIQKSDE